VTTKKKKLGFRTNTHSGKNGQLPPKNWHRVPTWRRGVFFTDNGQQNGHDRPSHPRVSDGRARDLYQKTRPKTAWGSAATQEVSTLNMISGPGPSVVGSFDQPFHGGTAGSFPCGPTGTGFPGTKTNHSKRQTFTKLQRVHLGRGTGVSFTEQRQTTGHDRWGRPAAGYGWDLTPICIKTASNGFRFRAPPPRKFTLAQ